MKQCKEVGAGNNTRYFGYYRVIQPGLYMWSSQIQDLSAKVILCKYILGIKNHPVYYSDMHTSIKYRQHFTTS